jgi:hypothetical protein
MRHQLPRSRAFGWPDMLTARYCADAAVGEHPAGPSVPRARNGPLLPISGHSSPPHSCSERLSMPPDSPFRLVHVRDRQAAWDSAGPSPELASDVEGVQERVGTERALPHGSPCSPGGAHPDRSGRVDPAAARPATAVRLPLARPLRFTQSR